jgi:putative transposase
MRYRRLYQPGGIYFFTVVTQYRTQLFSVQENIALLGDAFRYVMVNHPFKMVAYVILRDHLHMIWELPESDADFSTRWRLVKKLFLTAF